MNAIEIRGLKKIYFNQFEALKGIDLDVREGDFFALLGPNGAGKSTLIGILTSLVRKTSGTLRIFECDFDKQQDQAKAYLGLVPQEFNLNIFEPPIQILINQAGYYGISRKQARVRAEHYLEKLGLTDKSTTPTRMLSGGMKRRLMIARALIHEPKILILDEPTAGVDIELRKLIWSFLVEQNKRGITIILTTHYLEEAENLCRNIAIIDKGEIIEDTSMAKLLSRLGKQTYIIDLEKDLPKKFTLNGFDCKRTATRQLEVTVMNHTPINTLFNLLNRQKIMVSSFREKSNRLEQLFLELTGGD